MSELNDFQSTKLQVFTNPVEPKQHSNIYRIPQLLCVSALDNEKVQVLDVAYHQVVNCKGRDFRHNTMMVVDLHDSHVFFPNMGFVEVERFDMGIALSFEVNFQFTTWTHSLNLLSYVEKLRDRMFADHGIISTQENLYEEDLLHLRFSVDSDLDEAFEIICENFSESLELAHHYILSTHKLHTFAAKEIEIPQGYTQPANLILNFLVTIMKRRMPSTDIRQTTVMGMHKSYLRISYPRTVAKTVENILTEYSELIMGCRNPDCFFCSSSVMNAFFSRMKMAREEMSLVLSSSGKQASDEFLDHEMKALKMHLSSAIDDSMNKGRAGIEKPMTSSHETPPELSA